MARHDEPRAEPPERNRCPSADLLDLAFDDHTAGWELDSHTLTHADLTTLGSDSLRNEVAGSRRRLRRIFHVPVHFFCYPSGRYNERVIAAVKAAGYLGATTTIEGLATPDGRYTLRRVRVNGDDSPAEVYEHARG